MMKKFLPFVLLLSFFILLALTRPFSNSSNEPLKTAENATEKNPITKPSNINNEVKQKSIATSTIAEDGFSKEHELEMEEAETDGPMEAIEQDFNRTMNPTLGRPTRENLVGILQQMSANSVLNSPGSSTTPWIERGPNNVGGRTRAIMVDPNDATKKTIWSAGVDGGLWKTTDITATSPNWAPINDTFANLAITCMAYDSLNSDTMYFGTGEGWYNSDAVRGSGVWRTTNGGTTWSQLGSTTGSSFNYINRIAVHPTNHKVYIATKNGIYISSNAGGTFTNIGYTGKNVSDIEIAYSGRVHIGIGDYTITREYHYTDNDGTTWDPTATNFNTIVTGGRRVELAIAPSNNATLYALVGTTGAIQGIFKSTNSGITWAATAATAWFDQNCASSSSDFTRTQSWYDLAIAVNPTDENHVMIGGVDILKTTNGGTSWSQITSWWGGCSRQYVHADQHVIYYEPGSSTVAYFGNDGGIWRTATATATTPTIAAKGNNYNVTQFYSCAIHPTSGSNIYLAGAQDNGTQRFTTAGMNATTDVTGGDGALCFIDQASPAYQIASYVYNNFYLSTNSGASFTGTLINDNVTGRFINPAGYDNNLHILYTARSTSTIYRVKTVTGTPSTATSVTITGMAAMASFFKVSPYTTASSTVFIGNEAGKVYKVTNADNTPTITDISGTSLPAGTISGIDIGANENELAVTFFNYGVTSVWYTSNGGTSWVSKEGNLPDMPVRWVLFNPNNRDEVLLATELGVWATTNFSATTPSWITSNAGLANVRVDMLQYRSSDKMVFAATHGRGLYSNVGFSPAPIPNFSASLLQPCINQTVTLSDASALNPTSWSWSITPSSYSFVGGTTANSQNPLVQFTAPGTSYSITLAATNSFGSNNITKSNYITTIPAITSNTISGTQAVCLGIAPTLFSGSQPAGGASAVNSGTKVNEEFSGTLTPSGWNLVLNQNTLLIADTLNSYIRGGTKGDIMANNFNVSATSRAQMNTKTFTAIVSPEQLNFDVAHATYTGYSDSLIILTSSGATFTRLAAWGSAQTVDTINGITTAAAQTSVFVPTATQWCKKSVTLPAGTTQVRFEFYSGFGNELYIDRVLIDSFALPITYQWIKSTTSATTGFSAAAGSSTSKDYSSAALSNNTWFRRIVNSGSCTTDTSSAIAITVNSLPTANITAGGATTFCQGGNVTLNANTGSGLNYQWRLNNANISGATAASYVASASGVYKVVVTNSNGCIDSSNTITVVVNALPSATITPASAITFCQGGSVVLNANTGGGLTYQWRKDGANISGATSASYTASTSGAYKVIVTNANACYDSSSVVNVVVNSLPSATATAASATTFCQGGSVIINANTGSGLTYQWRKDGANISGATASSYTATSSGSYKVVVTNSSSCTDSSSAISVTVNVLPSATITPASAITFCQGGSVVLNANTGGGLTYQWRKDGANISGATSASYTASTSGAYKVIVTNANACYDSSSVVNVVVNSLPSATATAASATTFCQGGSVVINANTGGGLTYQWRKNGANISAANSPSYTATTSGSYKVVVTNSNSCSDSSSAIVVTVNTLPTATATAASTTTFCQGGSVVLNANSGSGLTYQWRKDGVNISSATNISFTANTSGNYKVIVSNSNGCIDSSNAITVTANALPTATITPAGATTFCQGNSVLINANTGSGLNYQWRKDGTNISAATSFNYSASAAGVYKVIITNSNGCIDSSNAVTVIVNSLPSASITPGGATTFCQGGSVTLSANSGSGLNYQWRKDGIDISGATGISFNASVSGNYKVVVTNTNGCIDSSSALTVVVNARLGATITANGSLSFCQGGSVMLNANTGSGLSYQWKKNGLNISGASSASYAVNSAGNYTVVVNNASNCSDSSTAVTVVVNPLPNATITPTGDTIFCIGGSVILNANAGTNLSYQWKLNGNNISGANAINYTANSAGSYQVVVTNANACKDSSRVITVTVNPLPIAPIITLNGLKLTTTSTGNYQWFRNDTAISGATINNYDITQKGTYKLRITDVNGCSAISNSIIISNVGIRSGSIDFPFSVYPNPADNIIIIEGISVDETEVSFMIINALGEIVKVGNITKQKTEIEISDLAKGVYLVRIGDRIEKFVKE